MSSLPPQSDYLTGKLFYAKVKEEDDNNNNNSSNKQTIVVVMAGEENIALVFLAELREFFSVYNTMWMHCSQPHSFFSIL